VLGYDDEGINEFFGNRAWQSIADPSELRFHTSALMFFTAEAFHYFLPSFMIAGIKSPDDCGDVVDATVRSLTPPKMDPNRPSFTERWSLFSTDQRIATVGFLSHVSKLEGRRLRDRGYDTFHEIDWAIQCLRETIAA
jgi:hypothetical protein